MVKTKGSLTGKTISSNLCGDFEVIEYLGNNKYIISFINTGTTKEVFASNIRSGGVTDEAVPNNLGKYRIGDILHSDRFGDAEVIDIVKRKRNKSTSATRFRTYVVVRFLNTGYITECDPHNFKKNKARDYLQPNVQGVGVLGYVEHISGRLRDMPEYRIWESVLHRCYGIEDYSVSNSSYENAFVEDRWRRFDYFLEDIPYIPRYNMWKRFKEEYPKTKNIFEFDKDMLIRNNKIYSRNTCMFVPKFINAGYTQWAQPEVKEELLKKLEEMDYDSIIEEAKSRKLL